jgi:hypothetical protein
MLENNDLLKITNNVTFSYQGGFGVFDKAEKIALKGAFNDFLQTTKEKVTPFLLPQHQVLIHIIGTFSFKESNLKMNIDVQPENKELESTIARLFE